MEDMKGKIRVYARVRPMLGLEYEKGQCVALAIPDELTVSHYWRNESKPREYAFDKVFDPDSTQDDVSRAWQKNLRFLWQLPLQIRYCRALFCGWFRTPTHPRLGSDVLQHAAPGVVSVAAVAEVP